MDPIWTHCAKGGINESCLSSTRTRIFARAPLDSPLSRNGEDQISSVSDEGGTRARTRCKSISKTHQQLTTHSHNFYSTPLLPTPRSPRHHSNTFISFHSIQNMPIEMPMRSLVRGKERFGTLDSFCHGEAKARQRAQGCQGQDSGSVSRMGEVR